MHIISYLFKVKISLEQVTKVHGGGGVEVQPYSSFNLVARWGGWSTPRPSRFTPKKDPVPIV